MSYTHDTYIGDFILANITIDNHTMSNATPTRKMFSSTPVSDEQYTKDNRGTSLNVIKALAKIAKVGPKGPMQRVVPNTPR